MAIIIIMIYLGIGGRSHELNYLRANVNAGGLMFILKEILEHYDIN